MLSKIRQKHSTFDPPQNSPHPRDKIQFISAANIFFPFSILFLFLFFYKNKNYFSNQGQY
uniref:Uncharacterized protein n=1 Tax=Anguilla anguilla TaxID=7936 RepID=A0A0E9SHX6_ANGAN